MEHGAKAHLKHLTEYFSFLYDFSKLGDEETQFLINVQAISMMANFYMGQKAQDYVSKHTYSVFKGNILILNFLIVIQGEVVSEEEEEEEVVSLPTDKYKPTSLEKMIALIAILVEKSRGDDQHLRLSASDFNSIACGKVSI
jgi:ubiquitin carboxyl-terminal hydrolase 34